MFPRGAVALALFAVVAMAGGVYLARQTGGYAATATATGEVTVDAPAAPLAGRWPARYCGSYGNVATQRGYAYVATLDDGAELTLADSAERTPGPQDPRRVVLTLTGAGAGGRGRHAWGPGERGSVVLSDDLLTATIDVRLAGATPGDTVSLAATFRCRPRVKPKPSR